MTQNILFPIILKAINSVSVGQKMELDDCTKQSFNNLYFFNIGTRPVFMKFERTRTNPNLYNCHITLIYMHNRLRMGTSYKYNRINTIIIEGSFIYSLI